MMRKLFTAVILVLAYAGLAMAGITAEEAAKLDGPALTIVGAEKAGSKDGLVAPYTGGITKGADGWYYEGKLKVPFSRFDPKKSGLRPDPFADDKVLFTVTAQNMAQYADKLTEGLKALLVKYPNEIKLNVYPSRRSMSYPQTLIDAQKKVAVSAKLLNNGLTLKDARMAFPFPIPKNADEALWNHKVRWAGTLETYHYKAFIVTSAGRLINTSEGIGMAEYPYWTPGSTDDRINLVYDNNIGPPNRVGEGTMYYLMTDDSKPMPVWQYLPGQRRVKLAPQLAFDNPSTQIAGAGTNDDTYMYNGSQKKFTWRLLGKRELIVPYNNYKAMYWTKNEDVLGPHFVKPEPSRWEVHRVWVVEGTVKSTERHIYKKRIYYLDEDSWQSLLGDIYDHNNKLWRVGWAWVVFSYDVQATTCFDNFGLDLVTNIYYTQGLTAETGGVRYLPNKGPSNWSPNIMAGRGVR